MYIAMAARVRRDRRQKFSGKIACLHDDAKTRLARQFRDEVTQTVCSSAWLEDCLYRGAVYQPDFQCACALCRRFFPHRRHPRQARQSLISADCQAMHEDLDPEIAEEQARLRNDQQRIGSVCLQNRIR